MPCLWHTLPELADMMWALTVEGAKRSGVISFFPLQCAGHHPSGCLSSKFHVMAPPHGGLLAAKRVASQWILPPRTQHSPPTLSSNPKEQFPSKPASKHFREHLSGPQLCPLQQGWTSALPGEGEDVAPSCRLVPFWGALPQSWRLPTCVISVCLMGF